jgi:tetratricopeptide (TPR) repeat protein
LSKILWKNTLICFGLAALVAVVFGQTRHFPFVDYDDLDCLSAPEIHSGLSTGNVCWAFGVYRSGHWAPLAWISYEWDETLFHLNPGIMHLENAALHAASTLILFLLLQACTGKIWRSALVSAVFAVHPLHVESVAWITERRDMLSGPPLLLCMLAYVVYARSDNRRSRTGWYCLSLALFVLSLLGKATAVTMPALLIMIDIWPLHRVASLDGRLRWRPQVPLTWRWLLLEKIPFAVISLGVSWLAMQAQMAAGAAASLEAEPLGRRLTNAIVCYSLYLRKFVVPTPLAVFYPLENWSILQITTAATALLVITAFVIRRRRAVELAGWFWFLIALTPVIGLFQSGAQAMADRYMYVPMIGLLIAVVWMLADSGYSKGLMPAAVIWVILLTLQAYRQTGYWQSSHLLRSHSLEVLNEGANLHIQLARLDLSEGDRVAAEAEYLQAVSIDPRNFAPEFDLGNLLLDRPDEAIPHYLRALQLHPHDALIENNLAIAFLKQNQTALADQTLHTAVADDPEYADAHANLGMLELRQNQREAADEEFRAALRIDPNNRIALAGSAELRRINQIHRP